MSVSSRNPDVVIIGGGVIGLGIAWRAAQAGLAVIVADDDPAGGASHAAAGMLCPVTEAHYGEEPLLALNLASARSWPSFAAELEEASGRSVGYRTEGTLAVAFDDDDLRSLEELHRYHVDLGLGGERLRARECRAREPFLSPRLRGGVLVASDHQVDTRSVTAALLVAAEAAGVVLRRERVAELCTAGGRVTGVRLAGGEVVTAGTTVLAAGCWSARLPGLPAAAAPPVRPVKGQILRLRGPADPALLTHSVRGLRQGRSVYLVPRADGRIVVGASVEEKGFDTTVTVGTVRELLEDAGELVPALAELELVEAIARLRPGTPDNAPLIGRGALPGLVVATGHYRNGILLAPVTAGAVADLLATGVLPEVVAPFSPLRFVTSGAPGVPEYPGAGGVPEYPGAGGVPEYNEARA
ncbi:MAG: glycine oxidase ThiO [Actinomycetota bacterium]|nr:glycine oxidase ThiO [Actinomycetota bacterium]